MWESDKRKISEDQVALHLFFWAITDDNRTRFRNKRFISHPFSIKLSFSISTRTVLCDTVVFFNFRMKYDNTTRRSYNTHGVITDIRDWGETTSIENLDGLGIAKYFFGIVHSLVQAGYQRNIDVRGAPYDFRKAPSKFGFCLKFG